MSHSFSGQSRNGTFPSSAEKLFLHRLSLVICKKNPILTPIIRFSLIFSLVLFLNVSVSFHLLRYQTFAFCERVSRVFFFKYIILGRTHNKRFVIHHRHFTGIAKFIIILKPLPIIFPIKLCNE